MKLQNKTLVAVIFALAVSVRLSAMLILETYNFRTEEDFGFGYGATAKHVALGEGFSLGYFDSGQPRPTAVAPPLYVYFLAAAFSIFGIYSIQSAVIIQVFQSLFAALTSVAFYYIGQKFSERVGLLAASGMAFYPASIAFSVMRISPIVLVVLLLGIIILYLFRIQEHWRGGDALMCGVLMGFNALLEPVVILFYVASCVWLFFWDSVGLRAVKSSLIMGAVCALVIFPWTIRNFMVFDEFVPVKSSMGRHLLEGTHPFGEGIVFADGFDRVFSKDEFRRLSNMNEIEEDRAMQRKALEFIKADPIGFVTRTLKRIYYYWAFVNPYRPTSHDRLRAISYGPVLVLAVIGIIFLARKKWLEVSLFLGLLASYPLFYYITQVTINRYRYGVEAFLLILASYAVVQLVESFRRCSSIVPAGELHRRGE